MNEPGQPAHTFLFADLAGFTALTEVMGDEPAVDLAHDFFEGARTLLPDYGAEEIKVIGDAIMVRADEPGPATQLAIKIVNELGARHHFPSVRAGLNTGPAVERGGDWFGATVNLAARVSGLASGGEILVTEESRTAAGEVDGVSFEERGRQQLRNVTKPVLVFAALAHDETSGDRLPIDPVCRMAVDPDRAAGTLVHEGTRHYFCSLDCVQRFATDPGSYSSTGGPS